MLVNINLIEYILNLNKMKQFEVGINYYLNFGTYLIIIMISMIIIYHFDILLYPI